MLRDVFLKKKNKSPSWRLVLSKGRVGCHDRLPARAAESDHHALMYVECVASVATKINPSSESGHAERSGGRGSGQIGVRGCEKPLAGCAAREHFHVVGDGAKVDPGL